LVGAVDRPAVDCVEQVTGGQATLLGWGPAARPVISTPVWGMRPYAALMAGVMLSAATPI